MLRRIFFVTILLVLGLSGISSANEILYNKFNIHSQEVVDRRGNHVFNASYANYTDPGAGHHIFAPGTEFEVVRVTSRQISLKAKESGHVVQIEYHEPRMAMGAREYLDTIMSPAPVSIEAYSALDQEGIRAGVARVGMTKDGVMAALGYPAAHRTPRLERNEWVYWTNRFATRVVEFDDAGVVTGTRQ